MFLIAGANMLDSSFGRSVILLCEHRYEGSFGLVLNQPMPLKLSEILTDIKDWDAPIFRGGPVQKNSLHFIHRCKRLDIGSKEIMPGVYWGGELNALRDQIRSKKISPNEIRFFVGYSGWGEGQLDSEIKKDSWYLTKASSKYTFFRDSRNLWRKIFQSMGKDYEILTNFPDDPRLN